MPVYEYQCNKCGHCFEFLLMRHDEQARCELCNSDDLKRLLSTFATTSDSVSDSSCSTGTCPTGTCSLR